MADLDDLDGLKAQHLCCGCVGEAYLTAEMAKHGKRRKCSYCGKTRKGYSIGELSERIDKVFQEHYCRTSDQPDDWEYTMLRDKESSYEWDRHGEPVVDAIMNAADMPEAAANDIQRVLADHYDDFDAAAMGEETEFAGDSYYEEKGTSDDSWQEEWQSFERSLKTEARFFSRVAAQHLATVFEHIETLKTQDGRSLVIDAGPGTNFAALYRARAFQSVDKLVEAMRRPDQHLGSPPPALANAGRMNARGISVFYGANDPNVALAEVRPPVGSRVAVARFEIIRPIRLLDLTAFRRVVSYGSVFDPGLASRLERAMFLRSLGERMAQPVMPDDEAFEYLPTQAVADFLATESVAPVDGIIFDSVQAGGKALNVVLFQKAARVELLDIPKGTEIHASVGSTTDEGWEDDYSVAEEVPPKKEEPPVDEARKEWPDFTMLTPRFWEPEDSDSREATLRIDAHSVKIHRIKAVAFDTDEHEVRRNRWEKREPIF
jgi:hypothetical protein